MQGGDTSRRFLGGLRPRFFLRWPPTAIHLSENNMVARASQGMIRAGDIGPDEVRK